MIAALTIAAAAVLLNGAIFGFFYAWVCSTMWGLDAADPRVAIEAMRAMNASVRNAVFAPAFFGTAPALWLAALLAWRAGAGGAGWWFLAAGLCCFALGNVVTFAVNVPMNEWLAATPAPDDPAAAAEIWAAYSGRWQIWNQIRAVGSGLALLLALIGVMRLVGSSGQQAVAA